MFFHHSLQISWGHQMYYGKIVKGSRDANEHKQEMYG